MTVQELHAQIDVLRAEVADLRRQLGNIPVRFGSGGAGGDELPRPRQRYEVLMCVDDAETVAFDLPRFAVAP